MGRHGVRTAWSSVPRHVRDGVGAIAGGDVVSVTELVGGFSPGPACRCLISDGRSVFVKAAGLELNPLSPGMHRREGQVLALLDSGVPAPRLIGAFDDGNWVALVIEWIDGRMPVAPLDRPDVGRLLRLVERLATIERTDGLRPCMEVHEGIAGHWRRLLEDPLNGLDDWTQRHLRALADLESGVVGATHGDHLVHLDLRSDNVIFATVGERQDVVVDWPGASRGAPWIDLVGLLPALELDGGPAAEAVFSSHPVGQAADADDVNVFLAAVAGYFTRMSLLPAPLGLPTVRDFQAAQGVIARRWLGERCGWQPAPG